jgi:hypothetical protein
MADTCSAGTEFLRFAYQATFVVGGWIVVHRLSLGRERDKSRREMISKSIDGLADSIDELLIEGREYHLADRDVEKEIRIKMTLQDLALRLGGLSELRCDHAQIAQSRSALVRFKRALTGAHFEDEHEGKLPPGAEQVELIAADALRTKQLLLSIKHSLYTSEER